eukprot:1179784-Prorocentrum_minimum.AAC.2
MVRTERNSDKKQCSGSYVASPCHSIAPAAYNARVRAVCMATYGTLTTRQSGAAGGTGAQRSGGVQHPAAPEGVGRGPGRDRGAGGAPRAAASLLPRVGRRVAAPPAGAPRTVHASARVACRSPDHAGGHKRVAQGALLPGNLDSVVVVNRRAGRNAFVPRVLYTCAAFSVSKCYWSTGVYTYRTTPPPVTSARRARRRSPQDNKRSGVEPIREIRAER